jgi:hypothetical protein
MIHVGQTQHARQQDAPIHDLSLLAGMPGVTGFGDRILHEKPPTHVRTRKHAIRQVAVVEVAGRLGDVVEDLDKAIQQALAEAPRGVVCDLSGVPEGAEPAAIEALATAGRYVRDWPGMPIAMASPDPQVRKALAAHPVGKELILAASMSSAVFAVLATPAVAIERIRLAPHPTAPRASRNFVTRTLLDWRLGRVIPFASLVVSELVSSSTVDAGTDIELCVAWGRGALRLSVRDHGPALPDQPPAALNLHKGSLTVVAGLSRAFGVLPTPDGGKAVWAILDAHRPQLSTRQTPSERAGGSLNSPVFTDGRGMVEVPFCAGSNRKPA